MTNPECQDSWFAMHRAGPDLGGGVVQGHEGRDRQEPENQVLVPPLPQSLFALSEQGSLANCGGKKTPPDSLYIMVGPSLIAFIMRSLHLLSP